MIEKYVILSRHADQTWERICEVEPVLEYEFRRVGWWVFRRTKLVPIHPEQADRKARDFAIRIAKLVRKIRRTETLVAADDGEPGTRPIWHDGRALLE